MSAKLKQAGYLVVVATVAGVGLGYKYFHKSGEVSCAAASDGVVCSVGGRARRGESVRICWQMNITCRNGSRHEKPECGMLNFQPNAKAAVTRTPLEQLPGCDQPTAVEVRKVEAKHVVL